MSSQIVGEGLRLLSAVVRDRSTAIFNSINPIWLIDNEPLLYDFMAVHLRRYGLLPSVETVRQNGMLIVEVPEPCSYYLNNVADRASYNEAIVFHTQIGQALAERNMSRVMELHTEAVTSVGGHRLQQDTATAKQVGEELLQDLRTNQHSVSSGVMTGYQPLDDDLLGLKGGELMIIAGRPKTSKTYILLAMTINAWLSGIPVLFVSMEMSPKGLMSRIASVMAGINPNVLRGNTMSTFAYNRVADTIRGFDNLPPFHFVAGNFRKTPADIARYANDLSPDLICIDGSYLLKPDDRNARTAKHEQLSEVIGDIKAMGEDVGVPSINTVQFNRMSSSNARGRRSGSTTSDMDIEYLAGTDAFGQVATSVMGIARIEGRSDVRRLKALVARDAEANADMLINCRFNPPDFSYISPYVDMESIGGGVAELDNETREEMV